MADDKRHLLEAELEARYRWYDKGSRLWSTVHHWSLGASAVLSTMSALVLKIRLIASVWPSLFNYRDDVAAVFAGAAAAIATLAAAGGFGRKWQANRISRGQIERLKVDFNSPEANLAQIRATLKDVMRTHDESIVGAPLKDR
jgi:hypothetical protein